MRNKEDKKTLRTYKIISITITASLILMYLLVHQPISDQEFTQYKQLAQAVYEENSLDLIEIPNGIQIERNVTSIVVSSEDDLRFGRVIGELENGNFVLKVEKQRIESISTFIVWCLWACATGCFGPFLILILIEALFGAFAVGIGVVEKFRYKA